MLRSIIEFLLDLIIGTRRVQEPHVQSCKLGGFTQIGNVKSHCQEQTPVRIIRKTFRHLLELQCGVGLWQSVGLSLIVNDNAQIYH